MAQLAQLAKPAQLARLERVGDIMLHPVFSVTILSGIAISHSINVN